MDITIELTKHPKEKFQDECKLGFGKLFTDHMFVMDYDQESGWHDARIVPYDNWAMDPATVVFHYSQEIFEGLKAYKTEDGRIRLFRQRDNFERLNRSCRRMCMAEVPVEDGLAALYKLLEIEKDWIPSSPGTSLYIRPFIFGTDVSLGVHASGKYRFCIILSPSGAYFQKGLAPVAIYVEEEYVRACPGGTGEAKTGGNYAASILAGNKAKKKGYSQVLWLDGVHRKYVEEVGAMNIFFVIDGVLVTPALSGSILPGITRDSIIKLAGAMGIQVEERRISIDEVMEANQKGKLQECFGSGTAAVVSPVGELCYKDDKITINQGKMGDITKSLYDRLTGIQYEGKDDTFHWTTIL